MKRTIKDHFYCLLFFINKSIDVILLAHIIWRPRSFIINLIIIAWAMYNCYKVINLTVVAFNSLNWIEYLRIKSTDGASSVRLSAWSRAAASSQLRRNRAKCSQQERAPVLTKISPAMGVRFASTWSRCVQAEPLLLIIRKALINLFATLFLMKSSALGE